MIDEDIIAQLGFTALDDYIGDPGDVNEKSYPDLIQRANDYWKKYSQSNNINSYINMFSLFDLSFFKQLEQLLPARANKLTGVLIQPNVLERSKDSILPKLQKFVNSYNVIVKDTVPTASAEYPYYAGSVENTIATISAIDDDQWQGYLTGSDDKYNGTIYSREYLVRSASMYITASTPYWRSEALCPTIISASLSEFRQVTEILPNTSASLTFAQFQDYLPAGIDNQRYSGGKMTSANFNVSTTQTADGGPVVEILRANPNQLTYTNNPGEGGSFILT